MKTAYVLSNNLKKNSGERGVVESRICAAKAYAREKSLLQPLMNKKPVPCLFESLKVTIRYQIIYISDSHNAKKKNLCYMCMYTIPSPFRV